MEKDLEIDDLINKLANSEQNIKQIKRTIPRVLRTKFTDINLIQKDRFVSMNNENDYKEFEQWLLAKT